MSAVKPRLSIVSVYETLVPDLPPSVCVAGVSVTAYGGASGVTNGEPVVEKPSPVLATTPSLTIDVTFFLSASAMLTVRCTVTLSPGATVRPDQVTTPPVFVPPLSAETKLVLSGSGSVIVDAGRGGVALVLQRQRVGDVARRPDRVAGVDLRQHERRSGERVEDPVRAAPVRAGRDQPVGRVEVELVDRDEREARAERRPVGAAVVAHERPDVGTGVERVRVRRVEDDRVDRRVRQVARDVRPRLAAVERAEDVTRMARRGAVEAVERRVGDPVVAPVDGEACNRPLREVVILRAIQVGSSLTWASVLT